MNKSTSSLSAKQAHLLEIIKDGPGTAAQLGNRTTPATSGRSTSQIASALIAAGLVVKSDGGVYHLATSAEVPTDAPVATNESARPNAVLTTDGTAAVAACVTAQSTGKALEITPSGKVAKMVRVSLDVRHSTDGRFIVAKNGTDATATEPWALYSVDVAGKLALRGTYPTCTAAFATENLAG